VDDGTYFLAAAVLVVASVVVLLDAALTSFETPEGLWSLLVAFATFLSIRAVQHQRRNGRDNGE
jgi:hypothetical protein